MSENHTQNYASHRRLDPWYHFVAFGLLAFALVAALIHLFRQPGFTPLWEFLFSFGVLVLFFRVRVYALRVQDRVIRMEETLRMKALLPEAWHVRLRELSPGQFVGLRFASDEELPTLVQAALDERLSGEAIKKRIRIWRPDTFRV